MPSELTNTIEQLIVYVHRNESHFTNIFVYHTNVFQADNIKNTSPKCYFTYIFLQFFSLSAPPMILLTAGAPTDPQLPARASNVYTTDARMGGIGRVASTGWHRPGAPPNKNPGYAGVLGEVKTRANPYHNQNGCNRKA